MAVFRVGQRVRIVFARNPKGKYLVGSEATIAAIGFDSDDGFCEYEIKTDLPLPNGFLAAGADGDCLEPLYDGHQPVSWSALKDLWQPTPEVETA